jgi:hypothetical protein
LVKETCIVVKATGGAPRADGDAVDNEMLVYNVNIVYSVDSHSYYLTVLAINGTSYWKYYQLITLVIEN